MTRSSGRRPRRLPRASGEPALRPRRRRPRAAAARRAAPPPARSAPLCAPTHHSPRARAHSPPQPPQSIRATAVASSPLATERTGVRLQSGTVQTRRARGCRLEKATVVRDDDQGAVQVASARSSCSTASRSRWLVGSSSTRRFTPQAWSSARWALVCSPGRGSRTHGDVARAEAELREQRACLDRNEPRPAGERVEQRLRRGYATRSCPITPRTTPRPTCGSGGQLELPEQSPDERRLPRSRSPGHRKSLSGVELELERAETERPLLDHGTREPDDE